MSTLIDISVIFTISVPCNFTTSVIYKIIREFAETLLKIEFTRSIFEMSELELYSS